MQPGSPAPSSELAESGYIDIQPVDPAVLVGLAEDHGAGVDRLAADAELVAVLALAEFRGKEWETFRHTLAKYAVPVLTAWIGKGQIFRECAKRGLGGLQPHARLPEDAEELAMEVVAIALRYFRDEVLLKRRWESTRGASLKTFFIGACCYQFPNVYRAWWRERRRVGDGPGLPVEVPDTTGRSTADLAAYTMLLRRIEDPIVRTIVEYTIEGYSQEEIAELLDMSRKAVESRMYRLRQTLAPSKGQRRGT